MTRERLSARCVRVQTPCGSVATFDCSTEDSLKAIARQTSHLSKVPLGDLRLLQDGHRLSLTRSLTTFDDDLLLDCMYEMVGGAGDDDDEEEEAKDKQKITIKVQMPHDDHLEFRIKRTAMFSKIYKAVADAKGIAADSFVLIHDGERIATTDSPKMLEMDDGELVEYQQAQTGGESGDEDEAPKKISLRVVSNDGGEAIDFSVKPSTKFIKIMDAIAKRKGIDRRSFRLQHESHRIGPDDTPKMLEMEDEDSIDMFIEQQGGQ